MAKEYIDREAVIRKLEGESNFLYADCRNKNAYGVEIAIDEIKHIPAADVAPVVHGRWMINHYDMERMGFVDTSYRSDTFDNPTGVMFCEVCKSHAGLNGHEEYVPSNYCPECGAKMDGGMEDVENLG